MTDYILSLTVPDATEEFAQNLLALLLQHDVTNFSLNIFDTEEDKKSDVQTENTEVNVRALNLAQTHPEEFHSALENIPVSNKVPYLTRKREAEFILGRVPQGGEVVQYKGVAYQWCDFCNMWHKK